MKKTKLLAASLFMLTLASCDGTGLSNNTIDTYEVTEDVWNNTFENWDISNATIAQIADGGENLSGEMTIKAESKTKAYIKVNTTELYVYEENEKYYLMINSAQDLSSFIRYDLESKQTFERLLYDETSSPIAFIYSSVFPDQLKLKDGFSNYTFDDSKNSYVGTVEASEDMSDPTSPTVPLNVEIKFVNDSLTLIEVVYEGDNYVATTSLKDIGTTSFSIPTNYVDGHM